MDAGIALAAKLIQHYESCKLYPYEDAKGVPTIGWGNTFWQGGTSVEMSDDSISQDEADSLFLFWLDNFAKNVKAVVNGAKDNEFAAFVSLAYNIGMGNFNKSTALREFLRSNKSAVGDAIEKWDRAGGQVLLGLQRRRRAERLVFYGAMPVEAAIAAAEKDFA